MKKEDKKHLSYYGIGPIYVFTISLLTLIGILLDTLNVIPRPTTEPQLIIFRVIGTILIIFGFVVWLLAVANSKIDKNIRENHLVTSGIYSYVRNPIYTGIMFVLFGILLLDGNPYLLILFPIYHILMTLGLKLTEEKWLTELYKEEYTDYCKKVNRVIPWFKKK